MAYRISLEQLAKEKLREQIIKDIDSIEFEIYEDDEPELHLKISKNNVELFCRASKKYVIAWMGSLLAILGGVYAVLRWLIPILIVYLGQRPP